MRAYLAGTGATSALIAGALVVFLTLAAFVAFNGLPLAGEGNGEGSISLSERSLGGVPESAAVAVSGSPDGVAATPAGPVPTTVAEAVQGPLPPATTVPFDGTTEPPVFEVPGDDGNGPLGNVLGGIGDTAGSAGLDLPLGPAADPLVKPLDQAGRNTLNGVGSLFGAPELGDRTTARVNAVVDTLLGSNGLVGRLLGGNR